VRLTEIESYARIHGHRPARLARLVRAIERARYEHRAEVNASKENSNG